MSNVVPGEGTLLAVKISSTYTNIAQVTSVDYPEVARNKIATTALADAIKKYRGSRQPDMGELTFHVNFDPNEVATHNILKSEPQAAGAPTINDWKLTYNDGDTTPSTDSFSGFIASFKETGMEEDGNVGADIKIVLTTVITSVAGVP